MILWRHETHETNGFSIRHFLKEWIYWGLQNNVFLSYLSHILAGILLRKDCHNNWVSLKKRVKSVYLLLLIFIVTHWYNSHYRWWQKWLPSHKGCVCVCVFPSFVLIITVFFIHSCFKIKYHHFSFLDSNNVKFSQRLTLQPGFCVFLLGPYVIFEPSLLSGTARIPRFTL